MLFYPVKIKLSITDAGSNGWKQISLAEWAIYGTTSQADTLNSWAHTLTTHVLPRAHWSMVMHGRTLLLPVFFLGMCEGAGFSFSWRA